MSDHLKQRWRAVLATFVVLLPVWYVAGTGPVSIARSHGFISTETWNTLYLPLHTLCDEFFPEGHLWLFRWCQFCNPDLRES